MDVKVGVVGLGRIGLPLAVALSSCYDAVGVDLPSVAERINTRTGHYAEPLVEDYLNRFGLDVAPDYGVLRECDAIFVCVGSQTPRGYSSDYLLAALQQALPHLKPNAMLVINTTLPPLEMRKQVVPFLRWHGVGDRTCYNPVMVALGQAVHDFISPCYLIIGEPNPEAGAALERIWRRIVGLDPKVFHVSVGDAAVAKYALNIAEVSKVSLLSFLTEFSEKEGSDIDVLTEILKAEPRVAGQKLFKGGLGYGGTCWPVDMEAIKRECESLSISRCFPDAITALNDWQVTRSVNLVRYLSRKKVSVLGLSFKTGTNIVVDSQPLSIARDLAEYNDVMVYDPRAMADAKDVLGGRVKYAQDLDEALSFGEVLFFAMDWPEFAAIDSKTFKDDQVVVDPWRMFRSRTLPCKYVPYGLEWKR